MGDLTQNFSRSEFKCRCGCGLDKIDLDLVDNLQHSRDATGMPYKIASGCRCQEHNGVIGGKMNSSHTPRADGLCKAADIECTDSHFRYLMVQDLIRRFRRIEIGPTWIHVDIDAGKPQGVLFLE